MNTTSPCAKLLRIGVSAASFVTVSACSTNAGQFNNASTQPAVKQSITDGQINADYNRYEAMQERIKQLNDSGKHPLSSYSTSKAQCWLDVSTHEYTRNDRSNFPKASFEESAKIAEYLGKGGDAAGAANPANQTPLVNDSTKLRPDLWDAALKLKLHPGFRCAAQKIACAEVELVHAGNEFNQQQWRHAKPYVQIAEDLISDAQRAAEACIALPAPKVIAAVVAVPTPAPVALAAPTPISLAANVLFSFDKRDMPYVRAYTKDQLDTLIGQIKSSVTVSAIKLVGHADRLNSTGDAQYNAKLSEDRVQTIKNYMVSAGVASNLISTEIKADGQQVEACNKSKFSSTAELQECLLPNRRVEVIVTAVKR